MPLVFMLLDKCQHDREAFTCGDEALDNYLRRSASRHMRDGIATTHVLIADAAPATILGYCSLAAAGMQLHEMHEEDRKRLPLYPVPAIRVGRLAVAKTERGKKHGKRLLGHALRLAQTLRQSIGVRVLVVDAKNEAAARFYEKFGFRRTKSAALTLYLPVVK